MVGRYGLAAGLTAAVVFLRLALGAFVTLPPYITFFPAILLSGWWGGRGPGLLTTSLCALASMYFWLAPIQSFRVQREEIASLLLFIAIGALLAFMAHGFRVARDGAERARRRLAEFLESTSDGFLAIDRHWRYTYVNRHGAELWRKTVDEMVGRTLFDVFPDIRSLSFYDSAAEVMETRTSRSVDSYYPPLDTWFRNDIYPIDDGIGVFTRDVTAQKRAAERQDELLRRERAARADSENVNRIKDEFLATLSHELRTPLNAIAGWAHLARTHTDADTIGRALAVIDRNVAAQTQLIEDLLDMSRIITGKLRLDVQSVDLGPVIASAIESVRPGADARGLRLQVLVDPRASLVSGDPARLQQVLWNLLSNAIKFTPRGGRVQVMLQRVNSHVELVVSDTGAGIAPEVLPHIFERFMQGDSSSTREHQGLGLGLALVRHIVEAHGGTIAAASAGLGLGATFTARLPVLIAHTAASAAPRAHLVVAAGESRDATLRLDGIRVLVVDDNREAIHMASKMLGGRGAEVTTVFSAAEALRALDQSEFDVLVSDIEMPDEDGYSLIRRIRGRTDALRHLPAVALTAYARVEDRTRALLEGFNNHLAKPVHPAELAAIVARAASSHVRAQEQDSRGRFPSAP